MECKDTDTPNIITGDHKKCLPHFPNCALYEDSDIDTKVHKCSTCDLGFYLDT